MENKEVLDYIKQAFDLREQGCYKQAIEMLYKALEIESDNLEILFQLGELYFLMKNFTRACQYLEKVIAKNETHIESLKLLRKIYSQLDDYNKAYTYAQKCFEVEKNCANLGELIRLSAKVGKFEIINEYENDALMSDDVMYIAAKAYYENKDLNAAKNMLEKAFEKNPDNADIQILRGKIYFDENNFEKSKEIFAALSKNLQNPEILNYQGLFALEDMNFIEAIKCFSKACSINKSNSKYYYNLGNAYFFNGWHDEAISAYLNAIKLEQDNLDYRYSLAYLYFEMNDFDKAKKEVDYILSHNSSYSQAIVLNALLKFENKDFLGAQKDLEDNLKKGFDDDFTLLSLAKVYSELGLFEKAEDAVKKVIARNPNNLSYSQELVEIYIKEKKSEKALEVVDLIINENENYISAYSLGAKAAYELGDYDKTKEFAQEAISLDMNYAGGYYYLALVRAKEQDFDEAIECMKRAIMYDVNNAEYYAKMSDIYKDSGDIKTALDYIKEAVNINDSTEYKIKYSELAALNRKLKKD